MNILFFLFISFVLFILLCKENHILFAKKKDKENFTSYIDKELYNDNDIYQYTVRDDTINIDLNNHKKYNIQSVFVPKNRGYTFSPNNYISGLCINERVSLIC